MEELLTTARWSTPKTVTGIRRIAALHRHDLGPTGNKITGGSITGLGTSDTAFIVKNMCNKKGLDLRVILTASPISY